MAESWNPTREEITQPYPLIPVLAIVVCAMLGGARSYAAIAEWATGAAAAAAQAGPQRYRPGSGDNLAGADGGRPGGAGALHAQREHATWLHGRGAHYLVTVRRAAEANLSSN